MPRSFLITKLHAWKDSDVVEDGLVSGDDVPVTDACTEPLDGDDQIAQGQNLSIEYDDFTAKISEVGDKSDNEDNFIGTSQT